MAKSELPTYTTILNPVDGSIASQPAMLHAIALAKLMGQGCWRCTCWTRRRYDEPR